VLNWDVTADGGIILDTNSEGFGTFPKPFTRIQYRFTITEPTQAFVSAVGENDFRASIFNGPISLEARIDELTATLFFDGKGPAGQGGTMFPQTPFMVNAILEPGDYLLHLTASPDPSTGISDEDNWARYRLTLPTPSGSALLVVALLATKRRLR